MPNVVVETSAMATMNAAVAANTGLQRAATHKSSGKSTATGTSVIHDPTGETKAKALNKASTVRASAPSANSRRGNGQCASWPRPMMSGATVTMPSPSERNQTRQMLSKGASVWKRSIVDGPTDGRRRGGDGGCREKAQHAMQAVEPERLTEPPLDQPGRQQRLAGVAKAGE